MGDTFGQWGRIALQASVVINNIGVLIVYMIIIGKHLKILKKKVPSSACLVALFFSCCSNIANLELALSQKKNLEVAESS